MLRIRIVSAGAALAMAALFAGSPATAQTNILAGLKPPAQVTASHAKHPTTKHKTATAKTAPHTKLAHRHHHAVVAAKAETKAESPPVDAAQSAPTADTSPVAVVNVPAEAAPAPSPTNAPANDSFGMKSIVVDGQTVPLASPNEVNAIDLAADSSNVPKANPTTTDATRAPIVSAQADAPPLPTAYAAPISKQDAPASPVGSAAWIAQVLAAFGGAVTAGVVAWFLIGGGPQRMYG
jgi:hypothetical protein